MTAEAVTRAEFARSQGWSRSYVTRLDKDGRLVLDQTGKRVLVAETLARIEETADPSKVGVAARHATARHATPTKEAEEPATPATRAGSAYQAARALRERFEALRAKLEYERLAGRSCDITDVQRAGAFAGAQLRSTLEALPVRLAHELASISDPDRIEALLTECFEQVLRDISAILEISAAKGES